MTADLALAVSPLAAWAPRFADLPATVTLTELPFRLQLDVRLDADGPAAPRVEQMLGGALPTVPCTARSYDGREVLWLGPDEWLIVGRLNVGGADGRLNVGGADDDRLEAELADAIGTEPGAVIDVSAQRTVLSLSGPAAAELLARGCAIDLHRQVAPAGTCVQTLLARCGVTIVVRDDSATRFLLLVRSSFADYLAAWLVDAATELAL